MKPVRALVLYARPPGSETLSYQVGWPRALAADTRFETILFDVGASAAALRPLPRRIDALIVLHSVFSNEPRLKGLLLERLSRLQVPKVFLVGNEYKLMPYKLQFAERLGVDVFVSQFTDERSLDLYRRRLSCTVVGVPNTGFDPGMFAPRVPWDERPIDVGYRAYPSPLYLGHDERRALAERGAAVAARLGLHADVSLDPADRLDETRWAEFLTGCKAQFGTEAGGDYFELDDATRLRVNAFLAEHPDAGIAEVRRRFFDDYRDPVPGRALSGRIVEAAATGTVQLLLEGAYGGFFEPGVHYLPIRRDLADLDDALEQLRDRELCLRVAAAAREVALSELTWERIVGRLHDALRALL